MLLLEQVFKKSGVPEVTFVEPDEYTTLKVSLRTMGRGTIVEGPSGIGKTTSVLKVLDELGFASEALILSGRVFKDVEVINDLPNLGDLGLVVIDDFHRLEDNSKHIIADFIKTLADEESTKSKIVVIGINNAGQALINYASDLTGRIDRIPFESNSDEKLVELISKGEAALNINVNIKDEIVKNANGSFHIAQMLCHETCIVAGVLEEQSSCITTNTSFEHIREKVLSELNGTFLAISKKFATGPRLRPEGRGPYFHLLKWLSSSDDWSLNVDDALRAHPQHRGSIGQVVDKGYLKDFFVRNPELNAVLYFDEETRVLGIEDPKFFFFISNILWNKFAERVGLTNVDYDSTYDFALSFAGEDREIAEMIFSKLSAREVSVFYDKNEQHRILAANVEDYLAPIYKTEATFILCILGNSYPRKIWTKFESDQFKDRFNENAVIPIRLSNVDVGVFDKIHTVGRIDYDVHGDIQAQTDYICDIVSAKLSEHKTFDKGVATVTI